MLFRSPAQNVRDSRHAVSSILGNKQKPATPPYPNGGCSEIRRKCLSLLRKGLKKRESASVKYKLVSKRWRKAGFVGFSTIDDRSVGKTKNSEFTLLPIKRCFAKLNFGTPSNRIPHQSPRSPSRRGHLGVNRVGNFNLEKVVHLHAYPFRPSPKQHGF